MYISQDPIGLDGGDRLYGYVGDTTGYIDILGLAGQRWKGKTKKDGTPYSKPGPKSAGTGAHNAKIEEIIGRETAAGNKHVGGGSGIKTEQTITGVSGRDRRMDASFERVDGSTYHVNVGKTLKDGKTGIVRERNALNDVKGNGHDVTFEGYAKASACK